MLLERDHYNTVKEAIAALKSHGYKPVPNTDYEWQDADGLGASLLCKGHYWKVECDMPSGYYDVPGGHDPRPNKGMQKET